MAFLWIFATKSDLNKLEQRIMKTITELKDEVVELTSQVVELRNGATALGAQVRKIGTETDRLNEKIAALEKLINEGASTDALADALAALKEQVTAVGVATIDAKTAADEVDAKVPDDTNNG